MYYLNHFKVPFSVCVCVCACVRRHTQVHSRVQPCDPMDCSLPDSSVHGIFQARILEWVAISFSRGFSQPGDQTCVSCVSCIGRQVLYHLNHLGSPKLLPCSMNSVHGILWTRILEWVAIPFSRGSSRPRDWARFSCIVDKFFTIWATREVPVALSKFSLFGNHHHHPFSQFFHLPQLQFYTHETLTPHSPFPRSHHSTFCLHESDYSRDLT